MRRTFLVLSQVSKTFRSWDSLIGQLSQLGPIILKTVFFRACKLFRISLLTICDLSLVSAAFGSPDNDYPIIDPIIPIISETNRRGIFNALQSCLY